jgi:hypothetical protein
MGHGVLEVSIILVDVDAEIVQQGLGRGNLLGPLSGLGTDRDRAMAYERVGEICADQRLCCSRSITADPRRTGMRWRAQSRLWQPRIIDSKDRSVKLLFPQG